MDKVDKLLMSVEIGIGIIHDLVVRDTLKGIAEKQRELLKVDAASRRHEANVVIELIQAIDIEKLKLEASIRRISKDFSREENDILNVILRELDTQRAKYLKEKYAISNVKTNR